MTNQSSAMNQTSIEGIGRKNSEKNDTSTFGQEYPPRKRVFIKFNKDRLRPSLI